MRRTLAAGLFVVLAAWAGAAVAQAPAASAAPAPSAAAAAPATKIKVKKGGVTSLRRPMFLGLICAMFLVLGAACGANDRPQGDPKPPGSPP